MKECSILDFILCRRDSVIIASQQFLYVPSNITASCAYELYTMHSYICL